MKTQPSKENEKSGNGRGRKGRKSAKRGKRRRRSAKKSERRRGNERESESVKGRETEKERGRENGTEKETERGTGRETERGIGGHVEATPAAAIPVGHRTGNGVDPAIAGGPGAETRTGTGNANAAGTTDQTERCSWIYSHGNVTHKAESNEMLQFKTCEKTYL